MKYWTSILLGVLAMMAPLKIQAQVEDSPALSNRLENPPDMVDRLVFFDTVEEWEKGELERVKAVEVKGVPRLILDDTRERRFPKSGRYITEEFETEFPFTELVPSWNPFTEDDTGLAFQVRTRDAETAEWSPWLYIGQWGRTLHWPERTLRFEHGAVNVDNLYLSRPADAFQVRVSLYSFQLDEDAQVGLRRLAVAYSGRIEDEELRARLQEQVIVDGVWKQSLPVPYLSQQFLDESVSGSTCSPTSVSMLLSYQGVERPLEENAMDIYDPEYGIFGNWGRAAALAGDMGMDAWVMRVRSYDPVKAFIAEGTPVIASIRFRKGEFPSNLMESSGGHLIVIRGFTDEGDVVVNDPAVPEKGDGVVYKADELARAWFDKGGVAYVIRSPKLASDSPGK